LGDRAGNVIPAPLAVLDFAIANGRRRPVAGRRTKSDGDRQKEPSKGFDASAKTMVHEVKPVVGGVDLVFGAQLLRARPIATLRSDVLMDEKDVPDQAACGPRPRRDRR
jgi:hypothetical protein